MNGVKQGGVLSPVLFAAYTDGILLRLPELDVTWSDTMPVLSSMLMILHNINIAKYDWFQKNE